MCSNSELLNKYRDFLKDLAEKRSPKVFTNGGGEFASILMGTMFEYTRNQARIFCTGFRRSDFVCSRGLLKKLTGISVSSVR